MLALAALMASGHVFPHSRHLEPSPPSSSLPTVSATSVPTVTTPCGPVDGAWLLNGSVAAFRGIRYAQPPVGERRFMPPEAAGCWQGRLDASRSGPACLQYGSDPMDEDCLSLNVFAPAGALKRAGQAALPVVVWIYGGSLVGGSATSYGPLEALVRKGAEDGTPFVLVAMNYRLGALGWAALPELAAEDPRGVAGNYGLLDQILALKWARDNIKSFGGDPQHVSLFGQSSGGTSIFALLASAPARGLFQGALSLSGSPSLSMDRRTKEKQDAALWLPRTPCAKASGKELVRCLRTADAAALMKALPWSYSSWGFTQDFPVAAKGGLAWSALAYVDGVTIGAPPLEALASGSARGVKVLFQSLQCEDGADPLPFAKDTRLEAGEAYLKDRLVDFAGSGAAAEVAKRYTSLAETLAGGNWTAGYAVTALSADTSATCGAVALARAAATGGAAGAYVGTVVQGAAGPLRPHGCWQGISQLPFHNFDFKAVLSWLASDGSGVWKTGEWCPYKATAADEALVNMLWRHWASFLTTGQPLHPWRDLRDVHPGGGDAEYAHAVLGEPAGKTTVLPGWKSSTCSDLQQRLKIGESYWWIN